MAGCHGVDGEVPRGEVADDGGGCGQRVPGALCDLLSPTICANVEFDAAERCHRRGVKHADDQLCIGDMEPVLEQRVCLIEPAEVEQMPALPALEYMDGPVLGVP